MNIHFYYCKNGQSFLIKTGDALPLTCAGEELIPLAANTTDGAKEKHVPVVSHEGGNLKVQVGSAIHPMLPAHYIQWIALVTDKEYEMRYLHPGEAPEAVFPDAAHGTVYEYCNLHGLWKAEF